MVETILNRADELEQAGREWRTDQQVAGSITHARELLEYELKETERFNAMIVKQTRHWWPAPGSADTELGVLMEPEVCHGETEVYTGVQA